MDCVPGQLGDELAFAEGGVRYRLVVRKHRDHGFVATRLAHALGDARAFRGQRLGLARRAVMEDDMMAGLEEVPRHRAAHVTEANKSDVHGARHQISGLGRDRRLLWKEKFGPGFS
jgi:hypothetical protein